MLSLVCSDKLQCIPLKKHHVDLSNYLGCKQLTQPLLLSTIQTTYGVLASPNAILASKQLNRGQARI